LVAEVRHAWKSGRGQPHSKTLRDFWGVGGRVSVLINGPALEAVNGSAQPLVITTQALPTVDLEQPVRLPAHSITVLSCERGRR
jgi:hypothetical protein